MDFCPPEQLLFSYLRLFKSCEAFTVFSNTLLKSYSLNTASERGEK